MLCINIYRYKRLKYIYLSRKEIIWANVNVNNKYTGGKQT